MGYTFAFQNPGSIFREGSATTGVAAVEIGTRPRLAGEPGLARVYFIDSAYRAIPLPPPVPADRRNKVP